MVVAAGASGRLSYREVARRISALGYDAVRFETNGWAATQDKGLRAL